MPDQLCQRVPMCDARNPREVVHLLIPEDIVEDVLEWGNSKPQQVPVMTVCWREAVVL
jgi:hypothetical protein